MASAGEIVIDWSGVPILFDAETPKGRPIGEGGGYFASYPGEFADFAQAILHGRPPAAGPASALGELRVALALYRSVESRRWEPVWE